MKAKRKADSTNATRAKPADVWKLRLYVAGQTPKHLSNAEGFLVGLDLIPAPNTCTRSQERTS